MKKGNWVVFLPFYLLIGILFIGIAHGGSKTVTTVIQTQPVSRHNTVIIDAGHGGIDGGATSCTGVLESGINLDIALRLNDLLRLMGHETVMIRSTDTSVHTGGDTIAEKKVSDLKERVRIVNETENAILISIHQNTFSDSRYDGAQVFYAPNDSSRSLAESLQADFISTLNPASKRTCKKADTVYLMQHIQCTGVLVECGFLSNPTEEAKLRNAEYQKQLCCVIASAVSRYVGN